MLEDHLKFLENIFDDSKTINKGEIIKEKMKELGFNFDVKMYKKNMKIKTVRTQLDYHQCSRS